MVAVCTNECFPVQRMEQYGSPLIVPRIVNCLHGETIVALCSYCPLVVVVVVVVQDNDVAIAVVVVLVVNIVVMLCPHLLPDVDVVVVVPFFSDRSKGRKQRSDNNVSTAMLRPILLRLFQPFYFTSTLRYGGTAGPEMYTTEVGTQESGCQNEIKQIKKQMKGGPK